MIHRSNLINVRPIRLQSYCWRWQNMQEQTTDHCWENRALLNKKQKKKHIESKTRIKPKANTSRVWSKEHKLCCGCTSVWERPPIAIYFWGYINQPCKLASLSSLNMFHISWLHIMKAGNVYESWLYFLHFYVIQIWKRLSISISATVVNKNLSVINQMVVGGCV